MIWVSSIFQRVGSESLPVLAGLEGTARTLDVVRAAVGDHIDLDTRSHDARIAAAGGELQFFERIEVVVRRRGAGGGEVGDVHTVNVPRRLIAGRALRDVTGLLARLVAADVDAVHLHAGGLLQDDP